MPPRVMTQSAGWPVAKSRGGGTGVRVGRGRRGRRPREEGVNRNVEGVNGGVRGAPDFSTIIAQQLQNLLPAMLAQVGNQGNVGNQNGNVVNAIVQENNVQEMSGCSVDQKVKYSAGSFMGKALTWWNSQIRTLTQEVAVSMSWNNFKFMMIEEFCPSHEMQNLETEFWNHAMVEASHAVYTDRFHELVRLVLHLVTPKSRKIERKCGEPSKDKNGRDDNKRTRTGNAFASSANPIERDNTGVSPKGMPRNVNPVNVKNLTVRVCYECGSTDHVRSACPRLNRAQGPKRNRPNQVVANNEVQGHGNQGNQARGRAFMLGAKEARQDPNIMTGIEPIKLGFRYEIEIASGQLVEIDKVIKSCKLEIEGHVFDIDLITFGHESFDVII
nr:reverse transcriptase domain-containing protein [Tanacetum cinerariifolium]